MKIVSWTGNQKTGSERKTIQRIQVNRTQKWQVYIPGYFGSFIPILARVISVQVGPRAEIGGSKLELELEGRNYYPIPLRLEHTEIPNRNKCRLGSLRLSHRGRTGSGGGSIDRRRRRGGMEHLLGLLKVRVMRGVNLAFRDTRGSDPYVVLRMGRQKLKTSVKKKNVNPVWNEDLTLSISEPIELLKLQVFDKDTFTKDDKMGDAELDIQPFIDAVRMAWDGIASGALMKIVEPSRDNCLACESPILYKDGSVFQEVVLRLRNVESGEVELQLYWVKIPGGAGH